MFESHQDLVNYLIDLKEGPLLESNMVIFRGNPKAKIMLIGEAPGAAEDKLGLPFVGRSGKLLDQILQSINLTEDDVYITNVVKRRPPQNRDPLISEIDYFKPILDEQIRLVAPSIIILVGRIAVTTVLGAYYSISEFRGKWFERTLNNKLTYLMPIYHPAYLLRNPSKKIGSPKHKTYQDMLKVKEKLFTLNLLDI